MFKNIGDSSVTFISVQKQGLISQHPNRLLPVFEQVRPCPTCQVVTVHTLKKEKRIIFLKLTPSKLTKIYDIFPGLKSPRSPREKKDIRFKFLPVQCEYAFRPCNCSTMVKKEWRSCSDIVLKKTILQYCRLDISTQQASSKHLWCVMSTKKNFLSCLLFFHQGMTRKKYQI